MRKHEQKDTSIKILNCSGINVNPEQEVVCFSVSIFRRTLLGYYADGKRSERF